MKKLPTATLLLSLGHLLNDFYCNFLPILLPLIMPRLGLSLTLSGLLVMVMSITSNMLQPVFGYFMDRYNFTKLLVPVLPFGALCICAIGFIDTKIMLFILIALTGLSVSAFHPLGSTLVAFTADHAHQGSSMSYYIAGGNIGFAIAPLALVAFTNALPLTYLPILILPSLIVASLYYKTGLTKYSTIPQSNATAASKTISLKKILLKPSIIKLNLAMGMRCCTHVAVATFLPLLLIGAGYSTWQSGLVLTVFLVGCTVGGLIGGYLDDYISHKKIIITALFLGFFPTYYFFTHPGTEILSILALFLAGGCIFAPQPSSVVWARNIIPANGAMASGMMMGLSFGIGSIGAAITAALADTIGLNTALLLTSLPLLFGAIIIALTPSKE